MTLFKVPTSSGESYEVSSKSFTDPTLVYLFRMAYLWRNQNSTTEYSHKICIECLGDSVTIGDPDKPCGTCKGTGRID